MKSLRQINQLFREDLYTLPASQGHLKKFSLRFLKIILLSALVGLGVFYGHSTKIQNLTLPPAKKQMAKIIEQVNPSKSMVNYPSVQSMNILVLGRPGQGYPGEDLTDTIIIVHLNLLDKKAALISLPRDLLVQIPGQTGFTRINHLYSLGGIEMIREKIEKIIGLTIENYLLVDLAVVKQVIDLIDGLNIYVPQDIYDPQFPGPNYSYQTFTLKAGWRYLDGQTALQYIRTRHSGAGDFDRMWRQQQILRALKQKVAGLNLFWDFTTYWKIFNTCREHIETDLSLSQMRELWQISQEISADQIIHLAIDNRSGLLNSGQIILGGQPASILWPKAGRENYSEIKDFIQRTISNEQ